jgi:hypothetical protein
VLSAIIGNIKNTEKSRCISYQNENLIGSKPLVSIPAITDHLVLPDLPLFERASERNNAERKPFSLFPHWMQRCPFIVRKRFPPDCAGRSNSFA